MRLNLGCCELESVGGLVFIVSVLVLNNDNICCGNGICGNECGDYDMLTAI